MSMEILLEKITEEKVILYHEVNGEIKATHPLKDIVYSAITDREPSFTYSTMDDEGGFMENEVYVLGGYAVIKSSWNPAHGYGWEEEKLTLIKLKTP